MLITWGISRGGVALLIYRIGLRSGKLGFESPVVLYTEKIFLSLSKERERSLIQIPDAALGHSPAVGFLADGG